MNDYFYSKDAMSAMVKLAELKGDMLGAFMGFAQKVFEEGALSEKTKELIAIGCAHNTQCAHCIDYHTRKAKDAGATDEEIAEAVMVGVAMSAGAAMAHSSIAMETLKQG